MKTLDERAKEAVQYIEGEFTDTGEPTDVYITTKEKMAQLIADQSKALTKANERADALVEHIANNDPEWEKSTVDRIFKEYRDEQAKQETGSE